MATVAELQQQLETLRADRASGVLRVQFHDRMTQFKSDAEMSAAIADLERRIATLRGNIPIHTVIIRPSKGL